jgi:hypothetical protein
VEKGRSSRKRELASRGGDGGIIDTTGESPVVLRRSLTPPVALGDEERGVSSKMLYTPRVRVTARPLNHPISAQLLAEPSAAPLAEPGGGVARPSFRKRISVYTRRLRAKTQRRKTFIVYIALFLLVAQTLVGALTPLGRSEQQAAASALRALGAVAPNASTPFPTGPTPQPVSTPAAFIRTMLPIAQQAHRDLGWPVSVVLAQMGVEHGWSFPDFDGWNLANSKVFSDPNGDGGVCFRHSVVRSFCYAPTPQVGLAIFEHVAHLSYYAAIRQAARTGGAVAAARALGKSPWDEGHYAVNGVPGEKLISAMNTFNLYQYDT